LQGAEQGARRGVVGVNQTIAEVPHQQTICILTEGRRCECQAPGRVEQAASAAGHQRLQEFAGGVEYTYVAVARTRYIELLVRILLCISDIELAADIPDVKRRKAGGHLRIDKGSRGQGNRLVLSIENIDAARLEIRSVQLNRGSRGDSEALIVGRC